MISFNVSLHNFAISNLGINSGLGYDTEFINLYADDQVRMTLANMSGHIAGDYSFCSDPPILADIGSIDFNSASLGIILDGYNHFNDSHL